MVGIIPKPIKRKSKLYEFAPHIVFGLLLAVVLAYVALFYLANKTSKTLWDLQDKIAQVGTKDEKTLEAQVLLDKRKIDDFSKLFANHKRTLNLFEFLEENCHPKVWFDKLDVDTKSAQVVLSGETADFATLSQQMIILQNNELVKDIGISDLSIGKNGRANFTISLLLDPVMFQNNE